VLGQQAYEAKSNEINTILLHLDRLALTSALVTIDGMGCQTKIVQKILDKGADYLIAIKKSWRSLHGQIECFFDDGRAHLRLGTAVWADGAEVVGGVVAIVADHPGARPNRGPDVGVAAFLARARFILKLNRPGFAGGSNL
jgi:hypothetical protein